MMKVNQQQLRLINYNIGIAYYKYMEIERFNIYVQQLISKNKLQEYLLNHHNQNAFIIDLFLDQNQGFYNKWTIQSYKQKLCNQAYGKVLETCAGSNRNLQFYKSDIQLTLIDWSQAMVDVGSSKVLPAVNFSYIKADVTKLPFADDTFDCVVDIFGLEYVLKPYQALKQIRRVCKKDGKIILLNQGISDFVYTHFLQEFKKGQSIIRDAMFPNRNWQRIIADFDFSRLFFERKKKGKLYIHVLSNTKNSALRQQL